MGGRLVLLCAGGTGGHLFPALALAHALIARGWQVMLLTDRRGLAYAGDFPAPVKIIASASPGLAQWRKWPGILTSLLTGFCASLIVIWRSKPSLVLGFGGYPTVPPVLAARFLRVPVLLHEANVVPGRANRWLARGGVPLARGLAAPHEASQKRPEGISEGISEGTPEEGAAHHARSAEPYPASDRLFVGNPLRAQILALCGRAYIPACGNAPFTLVVTGGSQGANRLVTLVLGACAQMSRQKRARLRLALQCPEGLHDMAARQLKELGITAQIAPFWDDLAGKIVNAHLVICRAGASSVSEIAALGRPALFIPLPSHGHNNQAANARVLSDAGAALCRAQDTADAHSLARDLERLMDAPGELATFARRARALGMREGTERLADLAIALADGKALAEGQPAPQSERPSAGKALAEGQPVPQSERPSAGKALAEGQPVPQSERPSAGKALAEGQPVPQSERPSDGKEDDRARAAAAPVGRMKDGQ